MSRLGAEDPFLSVQHEAERNWASIESDMDALRASPAAGDGPARRAVLQKLDNLQWDLNDMTDAVRMAQAAPARFGLTPEHVRARERLAARLAAAARRAREELAAGPRPRLLEGREAAAREANHAFVDDQQRLQEDIMDRQDEDLGHLAQAVERIGLMGEGMHDELAEQGLMLDELGGELHDTRSRMAKVREKLEGVMAETGPRQFCTIVWLCVTFLVLTVLVVIT